VESGTISRLWNHPVISTIVSDYGDCEEKFRRAIESFPSLEESEGEVVTVLFTE
jgi:hypothetical protein